MTAAEKRLFFAAPGAEHTMRRLAGEAAGESGNACVRRFPDGETYVRLETPTNGRDVVIVSSLHHPDDKLLPTIFLADTARELGATRIGLIAPYLPYLRQDQRFQSGEGLTSHYFSRMLSARFDWLATVDPHLHRLASLDQLYTIPTTVVHAAPAMGAWIAANVSDPLIIGPDGESAQWAERVAEAAKAPVVVLDKTRLGDTEVRIAVPDLSSYSGRTPVLVDDIISTAFTMIQTVRQLRDAGARQAVCVAVHPVFAEGAFEALHAAGAERVVTCNTIPHSSAAIDVLPLLGAALGRPR